MATHHTGAQPRTWEADDLAGRIADAVAEAHWRNAGCAPAAIDDSASWWVDHYQDLDYEHAALVRVFRTDPANGTTTVQRLFIAWPSRGEARHFWHGPPSPFSQQSREASRVVAHHFVDWSHTALSR